VADKVPVVRTAEIQSIAPQKPIAKQQKTQAAKPPAKTTKPSNNGLSEKMWKAKPEHYTVQVAAAYSESGVKAVKAGLPASKPSYIRKTVKNGKPWFVLIYGSFATKEEAARARDNLPASVKKGNQPWVRKQGEVFTQ
jgi:DamX protein